MKTWVVVASAARARVFELNARNQPLKELFDLLNPQDRLPAQALRSDKPGRTFDRMGGHRHAVETAVDPKEQEAIGFAKQIIQRLVTDHQDNRFERLCVVSPPHFLGLLREQMKPHLSRTVVGELTKDLTREDSASVQAHIADLL